MTPLALNRKEAAEFVGVSPTTFDKLVAAGHMPKARTYPHTKRVIWLRTELEEVLYELPIVGGNPYEGVKL